MVIPSLLSIPYDRARPNGGVKTRDLPKIVDPLPTPPKHLLNFPRSAANPAASSRRTGRPRPTTASSTIVCSQCTQSSETTPPPNCEEGEDRVQVFGASDHTHGRQSTVKRRSHRRRCSTISLRICDPAA